jgi:hypothetical protein
MLAIKWCLTAERYSQAGPSPSHRFFPLRPGTKRYQPDSDMSTAISCLHLLSCDPSPVLPIPACFVHPALIDIVLTVRARPCSPFRTLVALALPVSVPPIFRTTDFTLPVVIHHWPRELLRVHVLVLLLVLLKSTLAFVGTVIRLVPRADQTLDRWTSGRHMGAGE